MVKETRIIFGGRDILAFRLRCKSCSNEVVLRLDGEQKPPDWCPLCNDRKWLVGSGGQNLLQDLRSVLNEDPQAGAQVYLEIDGKDAE